MNIVERTSQVLIIIARKKINYTGDLLLEIEKYIKAKEDFKKVMEKCLEKDESVSAQFERELKEASEKEEICMWSYIILRENREEILNYYRECLGLT